MPNDPKEDEIPLVTWCDLLEKELKSALDDLAEIRKAKLPSKKRRLLSVPRARGIRRTGMTCQKASKRLGDPIGTSKGNLCGGIQGDWTYRAGR
jgi:hypothetical protein